MDCQQPKIYTFFKIVVPDAHDPQEWAEYWSDYYTFEYHTINLNEETILAWAFYDEALLIKQLEIEGIEFETFKVSDLVEFFGL